MRNLRCGEKTCFIQSLSIYRVPAVCMATPQDWWDRNKGSRPCPGQACSSKLSKEQTICEGLCFHQKMMRRLQLWCGGNAILYDAKPTLPRSWVLVPRSPSPEVCLCPQGEGGSRSQVCKPCWAASLLFFLSLLQKEEVKISLKQLGIPCACTQGYLNRWLVLFNGQNDSTLSGEALPPTGLSGNIPASPGKNMSWGDGSELLTMTSTAKGIWEEC